MKKIAVLIISCDNYSDLWETCSKMFDLKWPDCPYDKFLLSNELPYFGSSFSSLTVGFDSDWSSNVKRGLEVLRSKGYEYVYTMVEDYYFDDVINTQEIESCFNSFLLINGDFLRTHMAINPQIIEMVSPFFGKVKNYIPYRQTCAFSLWRIDVLFDLLLDGENAWEFEKIGVRRSFSYEGFYSCPSNLFRTINLVIKGQIVPHELKKILTYFPELMFSRNIMTMRYHFWSKIMGNFKLFVLNYFPISIVSFIYFKFFNSLRRKN